MTTKQLTKDELLDILRGTTEQQELERYAYYKRQVENEEIDFKEEEWVQRFYDFIDNEYDEPITNKEELKKIAQENKLLYIDDDGLEAISLLKEYNPVRYAQLGKQKQLSTWAWEMSDYRKERYPQLKDQVGYDLIGETYLNELVELIKSDHYFKEAHSETYLFDLHSRVFDTPRSALFHEYILGKLFTSDELDTLSNNYVEERFDQDYLSTEVRDFLDSVTEERQWLIDNKESILLFNEPVLNFVANLNTMDEVLGDFNE